MGYHLRERVFECRLVGSSTLFRRLLDMLLLCRNRFRLQEGMMQYGMLLQTRSVFLFRASKYVSSGTYRSTVPFQITPSGSHNSRLPQPTSYQGNELSKLRGRWPTALGPETTHVMIYTQTSILSFLNLILGNLKQSSKIG